MYCIGFLYRTYQPHSIANRMIELKGKIEYRARERDVQLRKTSSSLNFCARFIFGKIKIYGAFNFYWEIVTEVVWCNCSRSGKKKV